MGLRSYDFTGIHITYSVGTIATVAILAKFAKSKAIAISVKNTIMYEEFLVKNITTVEVVVEASSKRRAQSGYVISFKI